MPFLLNPMDFYSTRDKQHAHPTTLAQAVIKGLAPDGGLYMPDHIPGLPAKFFEEIETLPFEEINFRVAHNLVGDAVPTAELRRITSEALNFDLPIVEIEEDIFSMELFHGPTMAFKDVGARFMALLLGYFVRDSVQTLKVIVATSGDTGSAVAAGFFNVPGIEVFILYPKGMVSPLQEKQLTTWGGNITAIEVDGTFDDCQKMAKQALSDGSLNTSNQFTSANSINIARLIPQSFYYFHAFKALKKRKKELVVSVPSGNFGNLTGGLLAKKMGLPIHHFVAATNDNDVVPLFLETGAFTPRPSVQTISNAMDVGNPSNFERMIHLYGADSEKYGSLLHGYRFSDKETRDAMRKVYDATGYVLDPHGAVGYLGLKRDFQSNPGLFTGVLLETAHPVKFMDVVESTLGFSPEIPEKMQVFARKEKHALSCENDFEALRALIQ